MALFEDYLYARISQDEIGLEKGVTRQLREAREVSELTAGRIAGEFSDNDISAKNASPREDYDRLLAAVTAPNPQGVQRRIVCVHTSRLWRNRVERALAIDLLGRHGVLIKPKNGPELNLTAAAGRMMAGIIGEYDTNESETKAERVASAALERAEEGRANGQVLYGWQRVYEYDSRGKIVGWHDEERLDQAEIVREIVRRVLAGETLRGITEDLNRRGVPAPRTGDRRARRGPGQTADGRLWGKTSVKKIAMRPANIALRVYHRRLPDERLMPAAWPRLVDPDDHDRVVALLSDPTRGQTKPAARSHLLTWGIGECGPCGGYLKVAPAGNAKYGRMQQLYQCAEKGCVGRNEAAVDRRVEAVMVALLSRPDVLDLLSGSQPRQAELLAKAAALRARMDSAALQFAEGNITADQLAVITGKLKPQVEAAEAAARAEQPSPHLALVVNTVGEQAQQQWEGLSIVQKRAVMEAFGVRVIIDRTRRGPGFVPESVRVEPRSRSRGTASSV